MVALDVEETAAGVEAFDHVEGFGEIVDGMVDQVAGEEDEVGFELVHGFGESIEHWAASEFANVGVADVGDGHAVERAWEAGDGDVDFADAEAGFLWDADGGGAQGAEHRQGECGGAKHVAATHGGGLGGRGGGLDFISDNPARDGAAGVDDRDSDEHRQREKRQENNRPHQQQCLEP